MQSSGAQDPTWQRWIPKPVTLCKTLGSGGAGTGTANVFFSVPFPDSRLRVKISLIFNNYNVGGNLCPPTTLWMFEDDEGVDGFESDDYPLTNIVGTSAAPLVIPTDNQPVPALDPALRGYSREFVSAADFVNGRLVVQNNNGAAGYWILQTRYQPQSVSFSFEEWLKITQQCTPHAGACVVIS